jgi:hypothetical protein
MRYGVTLPPFADWSDPRAVMQMAADAEGAGWDGFFLWDHVTWDPAAVRRSSRERSSRSTTCPAVARCSTWDWAPTSTTSDTDAVQRWETAGATWWLENLYPWGGVDAMRSRLGAGPPRP